VQPFELKRVLEAFRITAKSSDVANLGAVEKNVYEEFLRKVSNNAGLQMVILCAIGLGRIVIKVLKN
jgi:hypothetical protein